jgi:hypothetical protein
MLGKLNLSNIRSDKYYDRTKTIGDSPFCVICGKPIKKENWAYVVLSEDLGDIVAPDTEPNGGAFEIGSDCAKNKYISPFVVREEAKTNGLNERIAQPA